MESLPTSFLVNAIAYILVSMCYSLAIKQLLLPGGGTALSMAWSVLLVACGQGSDKVVGPVADEIAITPGTEIQQIVNQEPPGTHFLLKAGVHTRQDVTPKDGMEFRGEPGAVMDGQGVTRFAFEGNAVAVRIRDLEITAYNPGSTLGAIQGYDARDWILDTLNVHHNSGYGANLRGHFMVRGGIFHHNSRLGISVYQSSGAVIDGVEISSNNPDTLFAPLWEAGGIKIEESDDVRVRGCHVHHNVGPGVWYDGDSRGGVVSDNLVTDNTQTGIFYEISFSGVIEWNTVSRNGTATTGPNGSGILVAASQDVEIHHNILVGNSQGIVGLQEDRGSGKFGPYIVQDLWVHDNTVSLLVGASGLLDFIDGATLHTRNNRFDHNYYDVTGNPLMFWAGALIRVSSSGWQALGQDPNSTFIGP